jgi:glycosyltransferase involved in cell wall biosynthesis
MSPLSLTNVPHISVAIPTCNRPHDLERCLESLTAVGYPSWDVRIVDQSDGVRSEIVAARFVDRLPSLVFTHVGEKGASRARNTGMQCARGDVIAFLDDDCTVEPDWLDRVSAAFDRHPDVSLIYPVITAAPHDPQTHFVPTHVISCERVLAGRLAFLRAGGISASMYLRLPLAVNGPLWDVHLGPGGQFFLSDDRDYTYRVLAAGHTVLETPSIRVVHHGARDYRTGSARQLVRRAPYSQGAMDIKLLRCGDLAAIVLILVHLTTYLFMIDIRQFVLRRGPTRVAWIAMYLRGIFVALRVPVSANQLLFGQFDEYKAWSNAS